MKPDGTAGTTTGSAAQACSASIGGEMHAGAERLAQGKSVPAAGNSRTRGGEDVSARILESRKEKYADPTAWCYLTVPHAGAERFATSVEADGLHRCFVHRTVVCRKEGGGVKREEKPTISGLVFLQGACKALQAYLRGSYPQRHLACDRATGLPAVIPDAQMQPFMRMSLVEPTRLRVLEKPVGQYAKGNVLLRVLTGPFAGYEGYLVRIHKDRRLVVDFGGMAVAIGGVHKETFEEIKEAAQE